MRWKQRLTRTALLLSGFIAFLTVFIAASGAVKIVGGIYAAVLFRFSIDGSFRCFGPGQLIVSRDGLTLRTGSGETNYAWRDIKEFAVVRDYLFLGLRSTVEVRFNSLYSLETSLGGFWERGPRELCAWLNSQRRQWLDARSAEPSASGEDHRVRADH